MNNQEILDYNNRCVEVLNLHRDKEVVIYNNRTYTYDSLKFHSDWNWIMEVVEAIEKITTFSTSIHSDLADVDINDEHKMFIFKESEILIGENGKTKKEAVVKAINQFLILYNENKRN